MHRPALIWLTVRMVAGLRRLCAHLYYDMLGSKEGM